MQESCCKCGCWLGEPCKQTFDFNDQQIRVAMKDGKLNINYRLNLALVHCLEGM